MLQPPAGQVQAPVPLLMAAQAPHMPDVELGSASACAAHLLSPVSLFGGSKVRGNGEQLLATGSWASAAAPPEMGRWTSTSLSVPNLAGFAAQSFPCLPGSPALAGRGVGPALVAPRKSGLPQLL